MNLHEKISTAGIQSISVHTQVSSPEFLYNSYESVK